MTNWRIPVATIATMKVRNQGSTFSGNINLSRAFTEKTATAMVTYRNHPLSARYPITVRAFDGNLVLTFTSKATAIKVKYKTPINNLYPQKGVDSRPQIALS